MAPRQRSVSTDFLSRARKQLEAHGRVALGGMNSVGGASRARGGGGLSVLTNAGGEDGESSGAAQLLVLSATGDSIASGGDYVGFGTVVAQHGFRGFARPQNGAWVHPIDAVYVLAYQHEWDGFDGGGTVQLELDGVAVPEGELSGPGFWSPGVADLSAMGFTGELLMQDGVTGPPVPLETEDQDDWLWGDLPPSGQEGFGVISYVAARGTVGKIVVTHDHGAPVTCDGVLWIAVTDPESPDIVVEALDSSVVSLGTQSDPDYAAWSTYPAGWEDSSAHWLWHTALSGGDRPAGEEAWLQGSYDSPTTRSVDVEYAGDNYCEVWINGVALGAHGDDTGTTNTGWETRATTTVNLIAGRNQITAYAINGTDFGPNPAGFILSIADATTGEVLFRTTDQGGWTAATSEPDGWPNP